MRRFPLILVFIAFFASGQSSIQQLHERQAQREWQTQISRLQTSGALPNRQPPAVPKHDSSTCILCNLLHAPAIAEKISLDVFGPNALIAQLADVDILAPIRIATSPAHCRGPPAV